MLIPPRLRGRCRGRRPRRIAQALPRRSRSRSCTRDRHPLRAVPSARAPDRRHPRERRQGAPRKRRQGGPRGMPEGVMRAQHRIVSTDQCDEHGHEEKTTSHRRPRHITPKTTSHRGVGGNPASATAGAWSTSNPGDGYILADRRWPPPGPPGPMPGRRHAEAMRTGAAVLARPGL